MSSVHEVIEAFRQAPSNVERGAKFEQLMVRFFELDPTLSQTYDKVWRWMDWPGRDGKPDTGIDLVAQERDTGDLVAIQCKFYEPEHTLAKGDIDSFFTASGKGSFAKRIIISTTDKWGKNAEAAIEDQQIPVSRIGMEHLSASPTDWDIAWPQGELQIDITKNAPHELRPHQQDALDDVFDGFAAGNDRGKLIMACGTGKTFTALKIAERLAFELDGRARILFAVPSISLLSQTLREWSAQSSLDMRSFAVCSDNKVSRAAEDYGVEDVAIPVTTDPARLAEAMQGRKRAAGLTVAFTTYQSLPVVAKAQSEHGVDPFDLVICDEAHRTTGVTLEGEDPSHFTRVHDAEFIKADARLYMTATPRLFDDKTREKAEAHSAEIVSMDDVEVYGPEFHRLSFGTAVERGLLTDYKVLVLTVDESVMAPKMQSQLATEGELSLDDASKIIGCWNGLAKRAGTAPDGSSFTPGEAPMRRAVAFAKDIATSKQIEAMFPAVVEAYQDLLDSAEDDGQEVVETNRNLTCKVHHVDGTYNALRRNEELTWLKSPVADDECRILTNARCLSEGVDVPALDAVLFLHPRNSVVDVVQSVGRVMRRSPGKDYGYIILPVAVPAGTSPSQALADNKRFKTVWQVLNALRAHDERFNAMVNSLALNAGKNKQTGAEGSDKLLGGHIGETSDGSAGSDGQDARGKDAPDGTQMALFALSQWQEAIYTRIVDKVGTRTYWEDWASDVADISARLITRVKALLDTADNGILARFAEFHQGLKDNLNEGVTRDDAVSMLAQHLITKPVFDALFEGHDFASHNPVSMVMQSMVDALAGAGLESETTSLTTFYDSVRVRASEVSSAEGKQQVIAELYERFFKVGFAKQAAALGIVYTPVEIVDFILRAADHVSREAFGRGLTHEGVHILDGFTGTGTFVTRLLQSGLIRPEDLSRKYASELHANEIMLLAYYIAAVNIETTFHALSGRTEGDQYEPFPGIVMADTFQISEADDGLDLQVFPANNDRITRQLDTPINVIIGNPPYSVGQSSANDMNANLAYPTLDERIRNTYAERSTAKLKNSLYDSYLRAFRWATDRIGHQGIVAFVSNGGWIDGNTADGIRLSLADEFTSIYVYNLRGNQRTAGELSRKEGGKIFGAGSRNTIAIWVGIKNPTHTGSCQIYYHEVDDYLTREEKLARVDSATIDSIDWRSIAPNAHGDWTSQRTGEFSEWAPIGDDVSLGLKYFHASSAGLKTGRDPWLYSFSKASLKSNASELVRQYREAQCRFNNWATTQGTHRRSTKDVLKFLSENPELTGPGSISWNDSLIRKLASGKTIEYDEAAIRTSPVRPFCKQFTYFQKDVNDRQGRLSELFPTQAHYNLAIGVTAPSTRTPFSAIALNLLPILGLYMDPVQIFPRWTFETVSANEGELELNHKAEQDDSFGFTRIDNVTDQIAAEYARTFGEPSSSVSKDDIFYCVYAQLHDTHYRERFAPDLSKMLPHLPPPPDRDRFDRLAAWGRKLADLHIGYEDVEPYPLDVTVKKGFSESDRETWRVTKMRWKSKTDHSTIIYSPKVTITGIPEEAERYLLGSRSALGWILDRYQVKEDKTSGIVNDPNDWCDEHDDPRYLVDLIKRITRVSVETMAIVDQLTEDSQFA